MAGEKRVKLSQWDALLLEGLRRYGWSNEELLQRVRSGELPEDESPFHFDYQELREVATGQEELFVQAVTIGYQIKYNTLGGIRTWLRVTLGKEPVLSTEAGDEHVAVELTGAEYARLQAVLSHGWQITGDVPVEEDDLARAYRIEPIQRGI